jgi:hypothetical protein
VTRALVVVAVSGLAALVATIPLGCGDDAAGAGSDAGFEAEAAGSDAAGSDADASVVPKGARVLGISVAIGDVDFQQNLQTARDAGARSTNVSFAWDELERPYDAGASDASDDASDAGNAAPTRIFNPLVHVANLVIPGERLAATLSVDALDVGGSRAPAPLTTRALDDPELGTRYDRVTDYVLDQTPDLDMSALFLASSVDVPLGGDAAKHAAFATFFARAASHAHAVRPKLKVGFTVTSEGAVTRADQLASAWAASDVIGVTYLPIDAAAHVRSPTEVSGDLDRLLAALPAGKPIVLRETGYPTAAECGSSEAAQVAFVSAVFAAWDRHPDRILAITFRALVDADAQSAALVAERYGRADAPFLAFLRSLGLRTESRSKPGFDALIREARARGF